MREKRINREGFVTIKKNVSADLQAVVATESYGGKFEYHLLSLVISESILIEEECNDEGIPDRDSYKEPIYGACRINNDVIEVCHQKLGWVPADPKLNDAYREVLADKALLGEASE